MKNTAGKFILELLLWALALAVSMVVPTATVFLIGSEIMGWGPGYLGFYTTAALLTTMTWGSWAALVWTQNRALRGIMEVSTLIPGILVLAVGFLGLYVGFGAWWIWLALIASSLGMMAASFGLNHLVGAQRSASRRLGVTFGLGLFPFASTAAGLGVASLWYVFITNPHSGDWRSLISIATMMVTVLAVALITTVVPAVISAGCRKASRALDDRPGV